MAFWREYESRGATFVSLDQALKDPVYDINHGQASVHMGSFLQELAYAEGYWTGEPGRRSQYQPSTIQRNIRKVRSAPLMCKDLFKIAG